MEFKAYPKIPRLDSLTMTITQKLHGCLASDTWITLADGSRKPIKEVVESKQYTHVLGVTENGDLAPTKILNKFNNGPANDWIIVQVTQNVDKNCAPRKIQVTPNHKFYVKGKGYVRADELKEDDKLVFIKPKLKLTYMQEHVLIGKMLGDGSFNRKKMISFAHKEDHKEYLEYTRSMLGWVAGNAQKNQISGYGTVMCRANTLSLDCIADLCKNWSISGGKKIVPKDLQLNPISMAFWYMDDGSLSHHNSQEDRAAFATNGFSLEDVQVLERELLKFGIKVTIRNSKGFRLYLNKDAADKMFTLIAPYVPPVMQYKLPKRYRGLHNFTIQTQEKQFDSPLKEQRVISVAKCKLRVSDKNRYDIETETHNYFADNILVHNSNASVCIYKQPPSENCPQVKTVIFDNEAYSVKAGCRTRWITPGKTTDNFGFAAFVFEHAQEFVEKLGEGLHYGEWAGPGVNSGEGLKEKTLILFEHWKYPPERPLPPRTLVVPVLYRGPIDPQKIEEAMADLKANGSKLVKGFMNPEGVVVSFAGQNFKKVFNPEETKWTGVRREKNNNPKKPNILETHGYLFQPLRLEKLLSKDEQLTLNFPSTLPQIVELYFQDLVEEGQIKGVGTEMDAVLTLNYIRPELFKFVKTEVLKCKK
jgi:hypothetical protein